MDTGGIAAQTPLLAFYELNLLGLNAGGKPNKSRPD